MPVQLTLTTLRTMTGAVRAEQMPVGKSVAAQLDLYPLTRVLLVHHTRNTLHDLHLRAPRQLPQQTPPLLPVVHLRRPTLVQSLLAPRCRRRLPAHTLRFTMSWRWTARALLVHGLSRWTTFWGWRQGCRC